MVGLAARRVADRRPVLTRRPVDRDVPVLATRTGASTPIAGAAQGVADEALPHPARSPSRNRALRPALAIAAAIAALLVGSASIGSKDAPRDSPLFALTEVLWPSRAASVASADQVGRHSGRGPVRPGRRPAAGCAAGAAAGDRRVGQGRRRRRQDRYAAAGGRTVGAGCAAGTVPRHRGAGHQPPDDHAAPAVDRPRAVPRPWRPPPRSPLPAQVAAPLAAAQVAAGPVPGGPQIVGSPPQTQVLVPAPAAPTGVQQAALGAGWPAGSVVARASGRAGGGSVDTPTAAAAVVSPSADPSSPAEAAASVPSVALDTPANPPRRRTVPASDPTVGDRAVPAVADAVRTCRVRRHRAPDGRRPALGGHRCRELRSDSVDRLEGGVDPARPGGRRHRLSSARCRVVRPIQRGRVPGPPRASPTMNRRVARGTTTQLWPAGTSAEGRSCRRYRQRFLMTSSPPSG